jgi:hypothetical protein
MKNKLYKVWCEWDIGLEKKVFKSKEEALEAAKQALVESDIEDNFDELLTEGYIGTEEIEMA